MYIQKTRHNGEKSVVINFDLHTFAGKAEEDALVDSGATDNFIDPRTVTRLKLGKKRMEQPRSVRNVDGSFNTAGNVTHYTNLLVSRGETKE